jgi:putative transposase
MPRVARVAPGGVIFHVLNRANARSRIFEKDQDYEAFNRIVGETVERIPIKILAYSIMPNHWHIVLWPTRNGELGNFVQRLTTTQFDAGTYIATALVPGISIRAHTSPSPYKTINIF